MKKKKNTNLGKKILSKIDIGEFVDDEVVNSLIEKTVSNNKYNGKLIFDGYPRNTSQAKNLDIIMLKNNQTISAIIYLSVPRNIIEKRILGRVTCEKCNITLNEYQDNDEIQNHKCGKAYLKKRNDDKLETIMKRYDTFKKVTAPLLKYYENKPSFFKIDASLKIKEISGKIAKIVNL